MTEVCMCGQTEPSYHCGGLCHFVDPEAIQAAQAWIDAAESVRRTCENVEEFDLLVAAQKKRLADLW